MNKKQLLTKIEAAKVHVNAAEAELDQMMADLRAQPRSQKTTVSEIMQSTFDKLRSAQSDVATLERLLKAMDD